MKVITIDTGTTNTRVKLWNGDQVIASANIEVGVRNTAINGNNQLLKQGVKNAIQQTIAAAGVNEDAIQLLLASGMITSNVGLYELAHLEAPVSIEKLAEGMALRIIEEVSAKPIWFIPGIKNNQKTVHIDNCFKMDIMRGEETETFGALEKLNIHGPCVMILTGSHTKFISIDEQNQVVGSVTTLAGELLSVLTKTTILANSLNSAFAESDNPAMILKGALSEREFGFNRGCFMVRLLDQFSETSRNDRANFLLGLVYGNDLTVLKKAIVGNALKADPSYPIIIGGIGVVRDTLKILLEQDDFFKGEILTLDEKDVSDLAGFGAIHIARTRGLIA